MKNSHVDRAWVMIVGTTKDANLSNSSIVKLVKVLNMVGVAHIVIGTSQTPTLGFTNWLAFSSISCERKSSWEKLLLPPIIWKIARSSSSISSKISSSLEVEVKLSLLEEETRRHDVAWVKIKRIQVWEELSLYSSHESPCLHLKLSLMILNISPKPWHNPYNLKA